MGKIKILGHTIRPKIDLVEAVRSGKIEGQRKCLMLGNEEILYINNEKVKALKEKLEAMKKEIEDMGIDYSTKVGEAQVVMYLYEKFQREIKYFHPIYRGMERWVVSPIEYEKKNLVDVITPYGAIVNNYALCKGIAQGMELACKYFGIECNTVNVSNCGIGHAMNRVTIGGRNTYLDIASEIGMSRDGLYDEQNRKRVQPLKKERPTLNYFGMSKDTLRAKGIEFQDNRENDINSEDISQIRKRENLENIVERQKSKTKKHAVIHYSEEQKEQEKSRQHAVIHNKDEQITAKREIIENRKIEDPKAKMEGR